MRAGTLARAATLGRRAVGEDYSMIRKPLAALAGVAMLAALSACEEPRPVEDEPPVVEEPVAPAAEDAAAPAAEPAAAATPPENTALPPEQRTSEESVQPESETLFY
jgi:hypothetical protein